MAETERVTDYKYVVRLPSDLGKALQEQASAEDRPIARIVRNALRNYLEQAPARTTMTVLDL
jgi:predicted transcriptional regulator